MKNSSPKSRAPVAGSSPTSSTSSPRDGGRPAPSNVHAPDPEVLERPKRRSFTSEYKLRILREVDAAKASGDTGAVGAVLRREGLYSSHLVEWRKQRETGEREGLRPLKRGPKPSKRHDPLALENARLRREPTTSASGAARRTRVSRRRAPWRRPSSTSSTNGKRSRAPSRTARCHSTTRSSSARRVASRWAVATTTSPAAIRARSARRRSTRIRATRRLNGVEPLAYFTDVLTAARRVAQDRASARADRSGPLIPRTANTGRAHSTPSTAAAPPSGSWVKRRRRVRLADRYSGALL